MKISVLSAFLFVGLAVFFFMPGTRMARAAEACSTGHEKQDEQIQCWLDIMRAEMRDDGIGAAMKVFSYVYNTYPTFSATGCHVHAHRVGDMAYYEFYLANPDLDALEFPQETASCGYGFYHGFFEHLIQDNPDPSYITSTCTYFHERLGHMLGDMRQICYHGSGHGLMLARTEEVTNDDWGNAQAFATKPLEQCEKLSEATVREKEECREGIYNVLVDWMEGKEYGFVYNDIHPFAVCDELQNYDWKKACYYEMSQKLDRVSARDPVQLVKIIAPIQDPKLQRTALLVGIAGMMQSVANTNAYESFMRTCAQLGEKSRNDCAIGVISGLFEHGLPQEEYVNAIRACRLEEIGSSGMAASCWKEVSNKLIRFYTPQRVQEICPEFPEEYRSLCSKK